MTIRGNNVATNAPTDAAERITKPRKSGVLDPGDPCFPGPTGSGPCSAFQLRSPAVSKSAPTRWNAPVSPSPASRLL
jgi:hypothetical protein